MFGFHYWPSYSWREVRGVSQFWNIEPCADLSYVPPCVMQWAWRALRPYNMIAYLARLVLDH